MQVILEEQVYLPDQGSRFQKDVKQAQIVEEVEKLLIIL
jgi:hypothetical protein